MTFRLSIYRQLESARENDVQLSLLNRIIVLVILIASVLAIVETEASIRELNPTGFKIAEIIIVTIFSLEYLLRLYAMGEDPRYAGLSGRLKYMISFWSIIDLLAILPFLLTAGTTNAFLLRAARLLRLLRLAKMGRFSQTLNSIMEAIAKRGYELALTGMIALALMLASSSMLYLLEGGHQPSEFGSIPRALWWSVATLTTVGYGDVTPITVPGRIFAGFTAVAGIGLIAMPTGILAAAFSDALQARRPKKESDS